MGGEISGGRREMGNSTQLPSIATILLLMGEALPWLLVRVVAVVLIVVVRAAIQILA